MQRKISNSIVYYQFDSLIGYESVTHGVFTRLGGSSKPPFDSLNVGATVGDDLNSVYQNRQAMAQSLGLHDTHVRTTWQVHGADVVVVNDSEAQSDSLPKADGIVTKQGGMCLSMRFADCVPLIFFDPVKRAIGLAHAGWRGTVANVAASTVQTMEAAFGCRRTDIRAGIGPSIGPCCYEVGRDVSNLVEAVYGDDHGLVEYKNGGSSRPFLNLWRCNELALRRAGVEQIELAEMCTASMTHEFFSHRAEGGNTGRFGVIIAITNGR